MSENIYPCLWFDGTSKAAAEFYCSIFKNSSIESENPMVVIFNLNGNKFMALNGGPQFKINPSISVFVHCKTLDECDRIWDALAENGKVLMAINQYPWSEKYGWIQDKYGMSWQIMKSEEDKLIPSLLFTESQFGKAKPAIDFYSKIFPNSTIDAINYYGEETPFSGKIVYAQIALNNYPLAAMDGPSDSTTGFNEAVSFVINCVNQAEIDYFWNAFTSDGGQESMCGWCRDKFGIWWQVVPSILAKLMSDPAKSQRVIDAFLKMRKFEIKKLLEA